VEEHLMVSFKPRIGDFFLIIIFSFISVMPLIIDSHEHEGSNFSVICDGRELLSASLGKDTVFTIDAAIGEMKIGVEEGSVFIIESSCPHKYCVSMGKTSSSNKPLVCLPNKVIINVDGQGSDGLDAILR
jgi:hypothetical protein